LIEGALGLAAEGCLTSGDKTNRRYVGEDASLGDGVRPELASLLFDPQTAGGLLISLAPDRAEALVERLRHRIGVDARHLAGLVPVQMGVAPTVELGVDRYVAAARADRRIGAGRDAEYARQHVLPAREDTRQVTPAYDDAVRDERVAIGTARVVVDDPAVPAEPAGQAAFRGP
jgi:hypothetical protein